MSKPKSRKMTGHEPSAEPAPQQLNLSEESEEEEDEEDEEEEEEATAAVDPTQNVPSSPNMNLDLPQNQASHPYKIPADQLNWFEKQTPKEIKAPRLLNGIKSKWKIFSSAHKIYKEEQNGIQSMVDLISVKARQGLLVHLQMDTTKFLRLTDEQITKVLDKHFKLDQISNYKEILIKCHMVPAKNDAIDIDKIQLYVEDFIDQLCQNPHFQRDKLRGAPPKIINKIFTDGFTPPVFRAIVQDLGTSKIETTIKMLPDIYSESEIYMKWKQRCDETACELAIDMDKEGTMKQKRTLSGRDSHCTHCLSNHPSIAKCHTDATCYFLHPELRRERDESEKARKDKDMARAKVAHVAIKTDRSKDEEIRALEDQLAFLTALHVQDKEEMSEGDD